MLASLFAQSSTTNIHLVSFTKMPKNDELTEIKNNVHALHTFKQEVGKMFTQKADFN